MSALVLALWIIAIGLSERRLLLGCGLEADSVDCRCDLFFDRTKGSDLFSDSAK